MIKILIILVVSILSLTSGCAHQQVKPVEPACESADCKLPKYVLGPGDVLDISVWKDNALDKTVTVRPDGMISYPLVNDVKAAGLTPIQLQTEITGKLKNFITKPVVSVVVKAVHSFDVSVLGNVAKPGRYQLKGQASVLDLIAEAGGLNAFASPSDIAVLRDEGDVRIRIPFDYYKAISRNDTGDIVYVHPGDIIIVP